MKCSEIIEILEKLAPLSMACDWDNPGLLAGRYDKEVKKILLALDATDEVVEEAVLMKADLLITHHPLIFKPVKNVNDQSFVGRRLMAMIQNDLSYYAMHTNFDAAPNGMGAVAAGRLGLISSQVLEVMGTVGENSKQDGSVSTSYGIGRYGLLEEKMTIKDLADKIKSAYGIPFVTVFGSGNEERLVQKVAVCPGSGGSVMKEALKCGAEVYVTGDIGHHDGIDALAEGLTVIDAGHYGIEHIFMDYMEHFLYDKLGGAAQVKKAADAFPNCVL